MVRTLYSYSKKSKKRKHGGKKMGKRTKHPPRKFRTKKGAKKARKKNQRVQRVKAGYVIRRRK